MKMENLHVYIYLFPLANPVEGFHIYPRARRVKTMSPPQPPAELNCTQKLVLFSLLLHIAYSQQHYTRLAKEHNAENLQLKLLATKAEGLYVRSPCRAIRIGVLTFDG